jgi:hypothetical protein
VGGHPTSQRKQPSPVPYAKGNATSKRTDAVAQLYAFRERSYYETTPTSGSPTGGGTAAWLAAGASRVRSSP